MLIPDHSYIKARPNVKEHHLTVAYFGRASALAPDHLRLLNSAVASLAHETGPIPAKANGIGVFNAGQDGYAVVDLIDGIGTFKMRAKVENLFGGGLHGLSIDYTHGFTPHMTREYLSKTDDFYAEIHPDMIDDLEFTFTALGFWYGENRYEVTL